MPVIETVLTKRDEVPLPPEVAIDLASVKSLQNAQEVSADKRYNPSGYQLSPSDLKELQDVLDVLANPPADPTRELTLAAKAYGSNMIDSGNFVKVPPGEKAIPSKGNAMYVRANKDGSKMAQFDPAKVPEIAKYVAAVRAQDSSRERILKEFFARKSTN
ncbi:MAG: hypothetical protein IPK67_04285 [Planctomycetes bacterium]|nr:hypothetical protein [Planctomycetota bacterium]